MQHLAPGWYVVLFERRSVPEQSGAMHQAIELAELGADGSGETVVVDRGGGRQIQYRHGRPRGRLSFDFIVDTRKLCAVTAGQNHGGPGARALEGKGAAKSAGGPGDQDHPFG